MTLTSFELTSWSSLEQTERNIENNGIDVIRTVMVFVDLLESRSVVDAISDEHRPIFSKKLVAKMRKQQPKNRNAAFNMTEQMLK